MKCKKSLKTINNEKGMVLVVVVLILGVLVLLGSTAIMSTTTDMKISGNYKVGSQAFYIADAGIERARNLLRSSYSGAGSLSSILAARTGGDSVLSDSSNIANFYNNGNFVTNDIPLIGDTTCGSGTYRVYLTNDPAPTEGITSPTDNNRTVTLTSFGRGPNNSLAVVQSVVKVITMQAPPGALSMPGPNVVFEGSNSNATGVAGTTQYAVALNSPTSETTVQDYLNGIGRIDQYDCDAGAGEPCIEQATFPEEFSTVNGINNLYQMLKMSADAIYTGATNLSDTELGSTSNRKIVIVDGDGDMLPNTEGAGILVVTGTLTLNGNFSYQGMILCIGEGHVVRAGSGTGEILGGILVANTNDAESNTVLGIPTFESPGGGEADIIYDPSQVNFFVGRPFVKLSWKQM